MTKSLCENARITLRPVESTDASLLNKWKNDALVRRMALDPETRVSVENQEDDIRRALESDDQLYLILATKKTGKPIGYIRIDWKDDARRLAWLRFALGEERGKGYAKDGLSCLIRHLFGQGLHRIDAEVFEFNDSCIGLLKRLGFKEEGVKRQAHFDGERYWNVIALGLLQQDIPNDL
jgi:RimJ/RimL family protein N-acetyltransferase